MQYLIIIGAAKCGTTSLAEMLEAHPQICISKPKENNYFTNEGMAKGEDWYLQRYEHKPEASVRIDASVSYSAGWEGSCTNIATRIHQFNAQAKILYLVRDPLERTWSAYWHARRSGYEDKSFMDSVANIRIDHIQASMYYARLQDYLQVFDRSQIQVMTQKSLQKNPQETVDNICQWLELDTIQVQKTTANTSYQLSGPGKLLHQILPMNVVKSLSQNARKVLPDSLQKGLKKIYTKPIPKLSETEVTYLKSLFAEDSQKLMEDFGVDVRTSHWWEK